MTELENNLLGCFIITPDTYEEFGGMFSEDDFENKDVFSAIKSLSDEGKQIDSVAVGAIIKNHQKVSKIISPISSTSNCPFYATKFKEMVDKKKLGELGQMLQYQSTGETSVEELINNVEQKIASIVSTELTGEVDTKQEITNIIERVKSLKGDPKDVVGISTGLTSLDKKLAGLQKSNSIILAARPSVGKTAFSLQIARNVAMMGHPVLFFSLEMSAGELLKRIISAETKVELTKLGSGRVSEVEMESIERIGKSIEDMPLYINDKSSSGLKDIRAQLKVHNSKGNKIELLIVDYLQLMSVPKSKGKNEDVSELSRGLKNIAKDFNIPVITLSQLSRDVEKRGGKPKMSDLRDSGAIEQDADIVAFLHREEEEQDVFGNKDIDIVIAKHRNGSTGTIPMKFDGGKMTFLEVEDLTVW